MYQAIVFLPLLGCVIAGLFGRAIGPRPSELVTTTLLFASMALSWIAFAWVGFGHQDAHLVLATFISSGDLHAEWALRIDALTAVMLVVVTTVSALVHLYSIGYMAEDPGRPRFFSFLSLFTFAMLMLVTADNLVQLFFGWEGVGLASYLLIGFWYHKPEANAAAIKAFIVNRIGDFGFALGIFAVFMMVGALDFGTFFGATTAFFAATVGLVQNDIKRIIAYSTCSQLGYMFVAMGVGAYSVGMFHLFTHASFKALLFLGSGSVITAMHHEQDIRKMGGLRDQLPITYVTMVIGTLALTGFPLTAGYFSKDAIIEAAYAGKNSFAVYAFLLTVIAAGLTAFYSWRLIFKVFHGLAHDYYARDHAHESPPVMLVALVALAAGSILAGCPFKELFAGHNVEPFFRESVKMSSGILEDMHHLPWLVTVLPTLMMAAGFLVAWQFYIRRPDLPDQLAQQHDMLYRFLLNKWYFDELYDFLFVRPSLWLGRLLWKGGDGWLIDGFGPDGISARVIDVTNRVVRLQTGYLYHYAFAMLIGVAALITWFMLG